MRIAISSTTGINRSGLIDVFLQQWPLYSTVNSWKEIVSSAKDMKSTDIFKKLLTEMRDDSRKYGRDDNVIYNRCTFDVMAYILWSHTESPNTFTQEYVNECIELFKESTKYIDIMFYIPLSRVSGNLTQTNKVKRIDDCLKFIEREYHTKKVTNFFIHDDRPALIELLGDIPEQIAIMKLYLNDQGDIDDNDSDILPPEIMELLESPEDIDVNSQINELLKTK